MGNVVPARVRMRVFLDTNVVFSGFYAPQGVPGIILERFFEGKFDLVISQKVVNELVDTMTKKLPEELPSLWELLVRSPLEIVGDPLPIEVARWANLMDLDDATILAAAVLAEPDYLVTGDKHFLGNPDVAQRSGLRIITPAKFVQLLEQKPE